MKRILALLLTLSMVLSLCTVALAANNDAIQYVALGDSTSMGFYVGTYNNYYCYRHDTDSGVRSGDYSTYSLFLDYLGPNATGTDLTATGMRTMELHAILDEVFFQSFEPHPNQNEGNGRKNGMICDSWCMDHLDNYMFYNTYYNYTPKDWRNEDGDCTDIFGNGEEGHEGGVYGKIHDAYTTAIQNADVITFDLLNGDALYLIDRIGALLGDGKDYQALHYGDETFAGAMAQWGCDEIAQGAEDLRTKVETLLSIVNLPADKITGIVDAFLYTYANMTYHFSKCVEKIYALNDEAGKDVKLIVVGPANPGVGLSLTYEGITLNAGKLLDYLVEAVTFYVVKCDANAARYSFADCSAGGVETCLEAFRDGYFLDMYPNSDKDYIYEPFSNSLIDDIIDDIDDIVPAGTTEKLTHESIADRIQRTCALTSLDVGAILDADKNDDIKTTAYQALTEASVDNGQLSTLLLYLVTGSSRGVLLHPSAGGCQQKVEYIIDAYENDLTADSTYLTRAVKTARYLTANVVGTMLGCKTRQNNLNALFIRLFTPIIDIRGLLGLIGK